MSACAMCYDCCATKTFRSALVLRLEVFQSRCPLQVSSNSFFKNSISNFLCWCSYCLLFLFSVFVNRSVELGKIKFFGFDMDYTLAGKIVNFSSFGFLACTIPPCSPAHVSSTCTGCTKSQDRCLNFQRIYLEYYYKYNGKIKIYSRFANDKSIALDFSSVSIVIL